MRSCGDRNCSWVGGMKAGAWTSTRRARQPGRGGKAESHGTEGVKLIGAVPTSTSTARLGGLTCQRQSRLTFAYALLGANLRAIFHGVQRKVHLRHGLLELDSANCVVEGVWVWRARWLGRLGGRVAVVHG